MRRVASGHLVFLLATAWAAAAEAVTDIRFERWFIPEKVSRDVSPPVDTVTAISVTFDAIATATDQDPAHGLRFAIAERDADGNDVLVRFETRPCSVLPPVGSEVVISAQAFLYCDALGELRAIDQVAWDASWCSLPEQEQCPSIGRRPAAALPSASESEAWEFVVLGDGDVEGSFATPEDVSGCGQAMGSTQYVAPEFAQSGSIGMFADPTGVLCSDHVGLFETFRWYVIADLEGMTRCGISVVELGLTPLPPGYFFSVIPHPNANLAGNPFSAAALGFDPCERADGERIILFTIEGIATEPAEDYAIVVAANPPSNMFWPYPWVEVCPIPGSPRRRMRTSTFYINPSPKHDCDLPVSATPATWSRMKALYRN